MTMSGIPVITIRQAVRNLEGTRDTVSSVLADYGVDVDRLSAPEYIAPDLDAYAGLSRCLMCGFWHSYLDFNRTPQVTRRRSLIGDMISTAQSQLADGTPVAAAKLVTALEQADRMSLDLLVALRQTIEYLNYAGPHKDDEDKEVSRESLLDRISIVIGDWDDDRELPDVRQPGEDL